jgi:hypothetical protein
MNILTCSKAFKMCKAVLRGLCVAFTQGKSCHFTQHGIYVSQRAHSDIRCIIHEFVRTLTFGLLNRGCIIACGDDVNIRNTQVRLNKVRERVVTCAFSLHVNETDTDCLAGFRDLWLW